MILFNIADTDMKFDGIFQDVINCFYQGIQVVIE